MASTQGWPTSNSLFASKREALVSGLIAVLICTFVVVVWQTNNKREAALVQQQKLVEVTIGIISLDRVVVQDELWDVTLVTFGNAKVGDEPKVTDGSVALVRNGQTMASRSVLGKSPNPHIWRVQLLDVSGKPIGDYQYWCSTQAYLSHIMEVAAMAEYTHDQSVNNSKP